MKPDDLAGRRGAHTTRRYTMLVLVSALTGAAGINLTEVLLRSTPIPLIVIVVVANTTGGLFLLVAAALQGSRSWHRWPAADWLRLVAAAATTYALGFLLLYTAIDLAGSSTTALLGRLEALFVVGLAVVFLGERWTARHWLASCLGVTGALLVAFDPQSLQLRLQAGELLALLGALVVAAGIIILKSLVDRQDGQLVTGYGLILGGVMLAPLVLVDADTVSATRAAIGSVGGYLAVRGLLLGVSWATYNVAMRHIGAARAAVLFLSVVVFVMLIQLVIFVLAPGLGLRLPAHLLAALLGGVLIGASIVLLHRQEQAPQGVDPGTAFRTDPRKE